jgi:hypothetical protein
MGSYNSGKVEKASKKNNRSGHFSIYPIVLVEQTIFASLRDCFATREGGKKRSFYWHGGGIYVLTVCRTFRFVHTVFVDTGRSLW